MDNVKPDIVCIEWLDVMSLDSGLLEKSDLEDLEPCHATICGFLVHETDNCYYIAKEWWETGQFKYVHLIPKNTAIIKITKMVENVKVNNP